MFPQTFINNWSLIVKHCIIRLYSWREFLKLKLVVSMSSGWADGSRLVLGSGRMNALVLDPARCPADERRGHECVQIGPAQTLTHTHRERGDALTCVLCCLSDLIYRWINPDSFKIHSCNTVITYLTTRFKVKRPVSGTKTRVQYVTLACFCYVNIGTYCCVCITLLQVRIAVVHNSNIWWVLLKVHAVSCWKYPLHQTQP